MNNVSRLPSKLKISVKNNSNLFRLLVIFIAIIGMAGILKPELFFRMKNFISIAKQFPEYGILALGIGLCMIIGGIDLSVVGIANMTAMITAKILLANVPKNASESFTLMWIIFACSISVIVGFACGALNGICISKFGILAMLATLGTQQLFTGISIVMSKGSPISGLPTLYSQIGNANLFKVFPVQLLIFIICALFVSFILSKTSMGWETYMLGTNEIAVRFAGFNRDWIIIRTHIISGVLSAIAGLVMMTRTNSAKADYGTAYIMQGVLVCVLGGVSPTGGSGNVSGIVLSLLILQSLSSMLNMFEQISNFYRDIIWGGALI